MLRTYVYMQKFHNIREAPLLYYELLIYVATYIYLLVIMTKLPLI